MPLTEQDYKILLIEKSPPGMEPVVKALKRKPGIDNPYAVAWSMYNESGQMVCAMCGAKREWEVVAKGYACEACESEPFAAAAALVRGRKKAEAMVDAPERMILREVVTVTEAKKNAKKDLEGPIAKVVLLTEGLGNLRDKNFYGPEAVQSMPALFEGAVCRINHQSYSEERDQPEGRVEATVGYYKNLEAKEIETPRGKKWACVGELHFDLSEAGSEAYAKAQTAVHYGAEFPGADKDYIGLSVNAYGDSEPRQMMIDGAMMEVNYVKKFVQATSCDMVTVAGRGGKILALVESVAGAGGKNQEVRSMIMKKLEEARKALAAAQEKKDWDKAGEALKLIEALSAELVKTGAAAKPAVEGKKKEDDDGDEDDMKDGKAAKGKKGAAEAKGKEEEEEKADKKEKKESAVAPDAEAHGLAVKGLIKEAGLNEDRFDMAELLAMSFQEAKREIQKVKRISESVAKDVLKSIGEDVRAGHPSKFTEAGGKGDNSALFVDCAG